MVCVLLLLPSAFLALGWLLEFRPHDTILQGGERGEGEGGSFQVRTFLSKLLAGYQRIFMRLRPTPPQNYRAIGHHLHSPYVSIFPLISTSHMLFYTAVVVPSAILLYRGR